jgi:hypothetical protein
MEMRLVYKYNSGLNSIDLLYHLMKELLYKYILYQVYNNYYLHIAMIVHKIYLLN